MCARVRVFSLPGRNQKQHKLPSCYCCGSSTAGTKILRGSCKLRDWEIQIGTTGLSLARDKLGCLHGQLQGVDLATSTTSPPPRSKTAVVFEQQQQRRRDPSVCPIRASSKIKLPRAPPPAHGYTSRYIFILTRGGDGAGEVTGQVGEKER